MTRKLLAGISCLRDNERGTSLLEFAFTAPIFVLMLVGLGDLARGISQKYALQQAVNRTIELAQFGSPDDDYAYLQGKAAEAVADLGDANARVLPLEKWVECDGNTTARRPWTDTCPSGQQTARYITLTIDSKFAPMFGAVGYPGAVNGMVPIRAQASLRVH